MMFYKSAHNTGGYMHDKLTTKELLLSEIATMRQQVTVLQALVGEQQNARTQLDEQAHLLALCADIGAALAGTDSLRTILQRCAEAMGQHLHTAAACIWTLQTETQLLEMQASAGIYVPFGDSQGSLPIGTSEIGLIAQERQPYMTNTALDAPWISDKAWVQRTGIVAFAGYPLLLENRLVGVMALFARKMFSTATQEALAWVAGVLAMGIDRICIADALARSLAKIVRINKNLRQKNAEVDEFASVASHDLRKPLHHLTTFSQLLHQDLGEPLPERAAQDLAYITKAAERLHVLIHNLLLLARLGTASMHWEPVALDTCVAQALGTLAKVLATTAATIQRDPLPVVYGDRAMLTQIYCNLLDNALKFRGPEPPEISITAERQEGHWTLGVKDNGIGIESACREQIFAPFKRLHGHSAYEGVGMGLAICRKAVERHGGSIWVESHMGQGTHVKFTLDPTSLEDSAFSGC
jgi:signal transduction histidine kinase